MTKEDDISNNFMVQVSYEVCGFDAGKISFITLKNKMSLKEAKIYVKNNNILTDDNLPIEKVIDIANYEDNNTITQRIR